MENEKEKNTVEDNEKDVEGTGKVETQTTDNNKTDGEDPVKSEAQKLADAMVAKKLKGMPTKEELEAFKAWQESQKTEAEKQQEIIKENETLKAKLLEAENKSVVANAGVDSKFQKFVLAEVSQLEGNFEDNLKDYLKDNPQYLQAKETTEAPKTNGVAVKKPSDNAESGVASILKNKHPELFKEKE